MPICLPSFAGVAQPASGGTPFANQYSVSFDASDDFVSFGSVTALNSASAFSVSVWYKKVSAENEGMIVGTGSEYVAGLFIQHFWNNNIYVGFGETATNFAGVAATSDTDWHHVAYVTDSGAHKLYWDGTDMSLGGTPPAETGSSLGDTFYLGKYDTYAPHFGGNIDELAVFNSALSSTNITAIYNSGVPNDLGTDGLNLSPVGWWRMGDNDGGTGTTITDQGSGGNDGTLTNGPTFSSTVPS